MNLETALGDMRKVKIAIVGDVCVDAYVFLSEGRSEISIETGLATRSVERFTFDLGGAGNVAINLCRLGAARVDLYGIIGKDAFGDIVRASLAREGQGDSCLVTQDKDWSTHVYYKFYREGKEEPRLDFGNFNRPARESQDRILSTLERNLGLYDAVIINEQVLSGYHDEYFQAGLRGLIARRPEAPVWISDCRRLNDVYGDCVHKLNADEARQIYQRGEGKAGASDEDVARWLFSHWKRPLIVTRGQNGAIVCDAEGPREILGLHIVNQVDSVGAGDAFLAAATACLASGASIDDAAHAGNFAAGVSVQKLYQTGHPAPDEILAIGSSPDYRYTPDKAEDPRLAVMLEGTDVEVISRPGSADRPGIAIFDHDGTISTLRQGWEKIMSRVMVECVLGDAYAEVQEDRYRAVELAVSGLIDRTTGIQTILQMQAFRKIVADFGYVKDIKTAAEYKELYNRELLKVVDARLERVRRGALSADDFTIKGSMAFLRRLRAAGISLCLASGTDVADVRREAEVLGYADCFDGGIYGSVGDVDHDPKRLVMDKIFSEHGADASRCAVFGDGPVEMREARKRGVVAIGVASDERQRFGMNRAKRPRLVLGGASAIIPDFSWADELVSWLGWKV